LIHFFKRFNKAAMILLHTLSGLSCQKKQIAMHISKLKSPVQSSLHFLHTTECCLLRKAPQPKKMFGIDQMWRYVPWPSLLLKAIVRKKMKPETLGPTEAHRRSAFHRLSLAYVALTWTCVGIGFYVIYNQSSESEKTKGDLPHQEEISRGGALYWIQALKTPDEMLNTKKTQVVKFKGLSYEGIEDVTVQAKEIGQAKNKIIEESDDFYLRKRLSIPQESEGGPSNSELREQFKSEGRDFELELDIANRLNRRYTHYNSDGTVGSFIEPGEKNQEVYLEEKGS